MLDVFHKYQTQRTKSQTSTTINKHKHSSSCFANVPVFSDSANMRDDELVAAITFGLTYVMVYDENSQNSYIFGMVAIKIGYIYTVL